MVQAGYIQQQPSQQSYGVGIDYPGVKVRDLQPEYMYQQVCFKAPQEIMCFEHTFKTAPQRFDLITK